MDIKKIVKKNENKIKKKEIIVETARKLFLEKGYESTKVEDITKEMGISKGNFYTYFKSKEEIFLEILEDKKEEHKKMLEKIDITMDKKIILKEYLMKKIEEFFKNFGKINMDTIIKIMKNERIFQLKKELEQEEKNFLKENVIKKYINENTDILTEFIFSSMEGFLHRELFNFSKNSIEQYFCDNKNKIEEILEFLDRGLRKD